MTSYKKPELLAPAGNLHKLQTALAFGADAVYFGLPDFSLRVRINEFGWEELEQGIKLAHDQGKRAYVTLNILAHNEHLPALVEHIQRLRILKPDALFISDPGVASIVLEHWPDAKLSLSTQANCTNWQSALVWQKLGFQRLVLSRELSLTEIKEIVDHTRDLEIEVFAHGALCSSYSGRCFLSDQLNGRSANQGDCTQPCRWQYEIKPLGHEQSFVVEEDQHGSYILNSQDLCLIKRLPEIMAIGVASLKIEGRAKSAYYLANVIGAYRRAIDFICDESHSTEEIDQELEYLYQELITKLRHRGYTEGFMFRGSEHFQNLSGVNFIPDWEFCGQVLACTKNSDDTYDLSIDVHNALFPGDDLEIISPAYNIISCTADSLISSQDGTALTEAHGGAGSASRIIIKVTQEIPIASVLRRRLR